MRRHCLKLRKGPDTLGDEKLICIKFFFFKSALCCIYVTVNTRSEGMESTAAGKEAMVTPGIMRGDGPGTCYGM